MQGGGFQGIQVSVFYTGILDEVRVADEATGVRDIISGEKEYKQTTPDSRLG